MLSYYSRQLPNIFFVFYIKVAIVGGKHGHKDKNKDKEDIADEEKERDAEQKGDGIEPGTESEVNEVQKSDDDTKDK